MFPGSGLTPEEAEAQTALLMWAATAVVTVVGALAVGACVCLCPKKKVLEASVYEVSYGSDLPVATGWGDQTVAAPHWRAGDDVTDGGDRSQRPGAYLIAGKGGSTKVRVTVRVTKSANVPATASLDGKLGTLTFHADNVPTAVGDHQVDAQIAALPGAIRRIAGDASWTLTAASTPVVDLGATRLEMFFLLAPPDGCYTDRYADDRNQCFRKKGVWVEALRFLCGPVGLDGVQTALEATGRITEYCHGKHGLAYDSKSHHYETITPRQGYPYNAFRLRDYLLQNVGRANCSDQAAAVCVLSCAVGSPAIMLVLEPFGYILPTNLMGIKNCNNPTPGGEGELPLTVDDRMQWVEKRWGFGTHVFCELEDLIFDACAGPHLGTEDRKRYVESSIDVESHKFATMVRELDSKKKGKRKEEAEIRAPQKPGQADKIQTFVIVMEVL